MSSTEKHMDQYTAIPEGFFENFQEIALKSQKLIFSYVQSNLQKSFEDDFDPLNMNPAFFKAFQNISENPEIILKAQQGYWEDTLKLWENTARKMSGLDSEIVIEPDRSDKRFRDSEWAENLIFDYIKQSYLICTKWVLKSLDELPDLDAKSQHKVEFHSKQWLSALSPTNFILTNPEILRETLRTNGENLLKGLENLLRDFEENSGEIDVAMVDKTAFEVGKNLAITSGKVVYQNKLIQLIQYSPSTKTVFEKPVLVVPPWINKYYVLDMQPKNSYVKWMVDQGYTVFMISWVNPDESYRDTSFEDYMQLGILEAVTQVQKQIGPQPIQAISYCLGGTLLAATLAYMKAKNDNRIATATFLTSLIDFKEVGDLSVFIDEQQLENLEKRMDEKGYLEPKAMMKTFNMLRSDDLIWSFVVNNYLLGKDPLAFDLLYWNSDATAMPAKMHLFYLRKMYHENKLSEPNGLTLLDTKIDLRKIDIPCFVLSTKEDHIAPWQSTYLATQLYKGPVTFCLSGSGHIAGVVNPPTAQKYGYWMNPKTPKDPEKWFAMASQKGGSWWPEWEKWQKQFSGKKIQAQSISKGKLKPIENAPGSYVKQ